MKAWAHVCRVFVQGNKKRGPTPIKGKEAMVVRVLGKGTVMLQPTGTMDPPTRLQQKYVSALHNCYMCTTIINFKSMKKAEVPHNH